MIRIFQGRSPFGSDRNHLHHLLTDLGMTHIRATAALISFNVVFVAFQKVRSEIVLFAILPPQQS
jgi:UDP-N-acetylmuramyl pentapeptide phosphotransferase/UDP-N-acetylglucosamine-1-phosphate transferase